MDTKNFDLPQLNEEDHVSEMFQKPKPKVEPQPVQTAPKSKKKKRKPLSDKSFITM